MHVILVAALVYVVSLVVRRVEECVDAGDELLWRAQGSRRAFRLLDWDPTTT